eukprot:22253-Eustigmatos_ZCMA.PRE.1
MSLVCAMNSPCSAATSCGVVSISMIHLALSTSPCGAAAGAAIPWSRAYSRTSPSLQSFLRVKSDAHCRSAAAS